MNKKLSYNKAAELLNEIIIRDDFILISKGKWWNACIHKKHRNKLCKKKGWLIKDIREYGMFAKDFKSFADNGMELPFNVWYEARQKTTYKRERHSAIMQTLNDMEKK